MFLLKVLFILLAFPLYYLILVYIVLPIVFAYVVATLILSVFDLDVIIWVFHSKVYRRLFRLHDCLDDTRFVLKRLGYGNADDLELVEASYEVSTDEVTEETLLRWRNVYANYLMANANWHTEYRVSAGGYVCRLLPIVICDVTKYLTSKLFISQKNIEAGFRCSDTCTAKKFGLKYFFKTLVFRVIMLIILYFLSNLIFGYNVLPLLIRGLIFYSFFKFS